MDLGLAGRRALVGGGGSGLGGGIATVLAAEGVRVALIGRTRDRVEAEAAKLDGTAIVADLATPDGPASAVEAAVAALGGLDLLVVNSGGPPGGTFDALSEADWETAIDGTLRSTLRLLRAALPPRRPPPPAPPPPPPPPRREPPPVAPHLRERGGAGADPGPDDLERAPPGA